MIIVTASTFFTVYVLNLHYRTPETHEMGTMVCVLLHSNKVKSLNNQIDYGRFRQEQFCFIGFHIFCEWKDLEFV